MSTGLPAPWTVRYSRSKKREYYFNPDSKQSQWDAPDGTDKAALAQHLKDHPLRVRCLHILLKHAGSRRPVSSRTAAKITLSKEAARTELQELHDRLITDDPVKKGAFEQAARDRSDCSSYKRGGDLGWFGRGEMQPAFEQAAFALSVGDISGIVDSDSGLHIIKRVA